MCCSREPSFLCSSPTLPPRQNWSRTSKMSSSTTPQHKRSPALSPPTPRTPITLRAWAHQIQPTQNSSGLLPSWATGSSLSCPGSFWKLSLLRFQRGHIRQHMKVGPQSWGHITAPTCLDYGCRLMMLARQSKAFTSPLCTVWTPITTLPPTPAGT